MKRGILIMLGVAALCVAVYWCCFRLVTLPENELMARSDSEMQWLRKQYHLSDTQFARIAALHESYMPGCCKRCSAIATVKEQIRDLLASQRGVTPEVETKLLEWTKLESDCRTALLRHVFAVSAEMTPEEGQRYVGMMTASIASAGHDHMASMSMK